jgi:hypothetical protein
VKTPASPTSPTLYQLLHRPVAIAGDGPPDTALTASVETIDRDSSLEFLGDQRRRLHG